MKPDQMPGSESRLPYLRSISFDILHNFSVAPFSLAYGSIHLKSADDPIFFHVGIKTNKFMSFVI